jgi:hypothetical protein
MFLTADLHSGASHPLPIAEANFHVSEMAGKFIYAVPVFGVLLVWLSDGAWSFSHTWVWLTIVIYAVALTISHRVMRPTVERILVLMREMASVPVGGGASAAPRPSWPSSRPWARRPAPWAPCFTWPWYPSSSSWSGSPAPRKPAWISRS